MSPDTNAEQTKEKFKKIEMGLKCIRDLDLLDEFLMRPGRKGQRSSWRNMKIRNLFTICPGRNG